MLSLIVNRVRTGRRALHVLYALFIQCKNKIQSKLLGTYQLGETVRIIIVAPMQHFIKFVIDSFVLRVYIRELSPHTAEPRGGSRVCGKEGGAPIEESSAAEGSPEQCEGRGPKLQLA